MFDYSSGHGLKIKVGVLLDNISVVNANFCLMVLVLPNALTHFYHFPVTLTRFQVVLKM